jgi:hypothetical protein
VLNSSERTDFVTEYGRERERRRKRRSVTWVLHLMAMTAVVSVKAGLVAAVLANHARGHRGFVKARDRSRASGSNRGRIPRGVLGSGATGLVAQAAR